MATAAVSVRSDLSVGNYIMAPSTSSVPAVGFREEKVMRIGLEEAILLRPVLERLFRNTGSPRYQNDHVEEVDLLELKGDAFYVRPLQLSHQFSTFMSSWKKVCEENMEAISWITESSNEWCRGRICGVLHENSWCRGVFLGPSSRLHPGKYKVHLVDFGTRAFVVPKDIIDVPEGHFFSSPVFAIECRTEPRRLVDLKELAKRPDRRCLMIVCGEDVRPESALPVFLSAPITPITLENFDRKCKGS